MPQTSFAERLQKIEAAQGQSVHQRLLVGLTEEQEAEGKQKKAKKSKGAKRSKVLPLRFFAGFAFMFATFFLMNRMNMIDAWLIGIDLLAPYIKLFRAAIGIGVIVAMIFFAFKLQRAAFRVLSEPARLPFAIGMVAGFAMGLGPTEFADGMVAQLSLE